MNAEVVWTDKKTGNRILSIEPRPRSTKYGIWRYSNGKPTSMEIARNLKSAESYATNLFKLWRINPDDLEKAVIKYRKLMEGE